MLCLPFVVLATAAVTCGAQATITVTVGSGSMPLSDRFASISFDSTALFGVSRSAVDFADPQLRQLTRNLKPAFLRVGGSLQDQIVYNTTGWLRSPLPEPSGMPLYYLNASVWDSLLGLVAFAEVDFVYGVNAKLGRQAWVDEPSRAVWNRSNVKDLFTHAKANGQHVFGWELGNEPNCFNKSATSANISALQLVEELREFAAEVEEHTPGAEVWGPDVSITGDEKGWCTGTYWGDDLLGPLATYLALGAASFIDRLSWHYYPQWQGEPSSSADLILTDAYQDRILPYASNVSTAIQRFAPGLPLVVGETSSFWGGGLGNVSNRFASGHWLLPQMGRLAAAGYSAMVRQDLAGGDYALVDPLPGGGWKANPDYFTTALWKQVTATAALSSRVSSGSHHARVHATCARPGRWASAGDVVLVFANLAREEQVVEVRVEERDGLLLRDATSLSAYILTPGDEQLGMESDNISLNGNVLKLQHDWTLPEMEPVSLPTASAAVPALSYGFLVAHGVQHPACVQ